MPSRGGVRSGWRDGCHSRDPILLFVRGRAMLVSNRVLSTDPVPRDGKTGRPAAGSVQLFDRSREVVARDTEPAHSWRWPAVATDGVELCSQDPVDPAPQGVAGYGQTQDGCIVQAVG